MSDFGHILAKIEGAAKNPSDLLGNFAISNISNQNAQAYWGFPSLSSDKQVPILRKTSADIRNTNEATPIPDADFYAAIFDSYADILIDPNVSDVIKQDIVAELLSASNPGETDGSDLLAGAAAFYKQMVKDYEVELSDNKKTSQHTELAIQFVEAEMAAERAAAMASGDPIGYLFSKDTEVILDGYNITETSRGIKRDATTEQIEKAEAFVKTAEELAEFVEANKSLLGDDNIALLNNYHKRFAEQNGAVPPELQTKLQQLIDSGLEGEALNEAINDSIVDVYAAKAERFNGIVIGVRDSIESNYPKDVQYLDEFIVEDAYGNKDMSALVEFVELNKDKIIEARLRENHGRELTPEEERLVAAGRFLSAVQSADVAMSEAFIIRLSQISDTPEIFDLLEASTDLDGKIDVLIDQGIIMDNPTEKALMKSFLKDLSIDDLRLMAQEGNLASSLHTNLQKNVSGTLGHIFEERVAASTQGQTERSINDAISRYSKHPQIVAEIEIWRAELGSVNSRSKLSLMETLADGTLTVTDNAGAVDVNATIANMTSARYEYLGQSDAYATSVRIAQSKDLANIYPGEPEAGVANGHQEYYARFKTTAGQMGVNFVAYAPTTAGETHEQKFERTSQNLASAITALRAVEDPNLPGNYDTSKVFIAKEVRDELISIGFFDKNNPAHVVQLNELTQQGKRVYAQMVDNYLVQDSGRALIAQANDNMKNPDIEMSDWEPEVRMAHMMRVMHIKSEIRINIRSFGEAIKESAMSSERLGEIIAQSVEISKTDAQAAIEFLTSKTSLSANSFDAKVFAGTGLIAMQKMSPQELHDMAYAMDDPEQTDRLIANLMQKVLPEGLSVEALKRHGLLDEAMASVSVAIGGAIQNNQPLPDEDAMARILESYSDIIPLMDKAAQYNVGDVYEGAEGFVSVTRREGDSDRDFAYRIQAAESWLDFGYDDVEDISVPANTPAGENQTEESLVR